MPWRTETEQPPCALVARPPALAVRDLDLQGGSNRRSSIRVDVCHGSSFTRTQSKASSIFDVTLRVFQAADKEGVSPAVAADRLAEERMRSVGRLASIRLPR
jgi:hypothetical protein